MESKWRCVTWLTGKCIEKKTSLVLLMRKMENPIMNVRIWMEMRKADVLSGCPNIGKTILTIPGSLFYRENHPDHTGKPVLSEIQKQIIIQMIACSNPNIQFNGICLAENFQLKEAIPAIEKATSCTLTPDDILDEEGMLIVSSTRSVAEHARIVLKRFGYHIS